VHEKISFSNIIERAESWIFVKFCTRAPGKRFSALELLIKLKLFRPWPQELDGGQREDKIKIIALACGLVAYPAAVQFNNMPDKGESVPGSRLRLAVSAPEPFGVQGCRIMGWQVMAGGSRP